MRTITIALVSFAVLAILVGINRLEGQTMDEEQLLKEFVALTPNEVPGLDVKSIVRRWETGKGVMLIQGLYRKGTGIAGRDPMEILIRASIASDRDLAYQAAISETSSQIALYPDGAGMPQGSWTGLPIGEKSWATAPKAEKPAPGLGTANLVVWDDRLAMRVIIDYQPIDPKAKTAIFLPVADEDMQLGELAARLILAKASLGLLGWQDLPQLRLVVNGASLPAKEYQGTFFVPVTATLNRLGVNVERRSGVFAFSWRGRQVTLPVGSRVMLVGRWQVQRVKAFNDVGARKLVAAEGTVNLSHPVMFDGREYWVDGKGLAKALGMKVQRSRRTVTFVP